MLRTLFIAISLFLLDILFLNMLTVMPLVIFMVINVSITLFKYAKVFVSKRGAQPTIQTWIEHLIYIVLVGLIITANIYNNKYAKPRANILIKYCEQYQKKHGEYPSKLTDLVPEYLDKIPSPKQITLFNNRFIYRKRDEKFYLEYTVVQPFKVEIYSSELHKWSSLD